MANTAADVIATTKQCTPIVPTLGTQVAVVAGENRTVRKPDGTGYFVEDLPNVVIVCTRVHRLIGDGDLVVVQ